MKKYTYPETKGNVVKENSLLLSLDEQIEDLEMQIKQLKKLRDDEYLKSIFSDFDEKV